MLLSNEYTLIPHIKITLKYDDGIVQHHILKEDDIIICKYRENTKISTINGKITKIGYKLNSSFAVINRTIYLQIDGSDKHAGHVVYVNIDDIVGIKVLKTGSMISNPVCTVANEDQAVCMLRENENGQLEYSKDGLEWKTVGAVLPTKPEHKEEEKPVVDEHSATGGGSNEKREENSERENSGKDTTVESNSGNVSENNQGHAVSPVVEKDNKAVETDPKPSVEEKHEENTSAHVDESHTESPSVATEDHHADTSLQPQPSTDDHSVNTEDTSSHNTVEEKHEDTPTNVARSEDGKREEATHTTGETTHIESSSVTTEDHHDETGLQPPTGDTTHTETNDVVNSETHESETHTESSPVAAEDIHATAETHDESGLHNEEGLIKPPENHTEENTHHEEANRVIDNGIHEEQPVAAVPQPVIDNGIHTEPVVANPVSNDHNSETTTPIATEGVTGSSSEDVARVSDGHEEPREDSQ